MKTVEEILKGFTLVVESGVQGRTAILAEEFIEFYREKEMIWDGKEDKIKEQTQEILDLKNTIAKLNTQIEDTFTLTYSQLINGKIVDKEIKGITKSDYDKMYAMYGDQWIGHSLKKDDVNSKDQIISQLKARISELEEKLNNSVAK